MRSRVSAPLRSTHGVNPCARRPLPAYAGRSAGGTVGRRCIAIRENHPSLGQLVEVGRMVELTAHKPYIHHP